MPYSSGGGGGSTSPSITDIDTAAVVVQTWSSQSYVVGTWYNLSINSGMKQLYKCVQSYTGTFSALYQHREGACLANGDLVLALPS